MARDPGRALTAGEIALCRPFFAGRIDYPQVRVHRARWWPLQPRETVMAPDGDIWCPPGGSAWQADFADAALPLQGLFVHEMVHVWQHQRGLFLPLRRHPFCRYGYVLRPGWALTRYGIEQQAEIVRHAFLLRHGAPVPGAPALEVYEGLLAGIV